MTSRRRTAAAILMAALAVVPMVLSVTVALSLGVAMETGAWGIGAAGMAFGLVGAVIVAKVPGNPLGLVFVGISIAVVVSGFQSFARPLIEAGVSTSWVVIGQVLADASFMTMLYLVLVLTPSWFPTGRPISRRWGWPNVAATVAWVALVGMSLFSSPVKILWDPTATVDDQVWRGFENPIGLGFMPNSEDSDLGAIAAVVIVVAGIFAVVSLVLRYRRSAAVERSQIRSLVVAFLVVIPTVTVAAVFGDSSTGAVAVMFELLFSIAVLSVPVAAGLSILKFRLYEIDLIVSKAVTFGVLAVFITGVYSLVVVGIGSLMGTGDEPSLLLSIAAVAIVAVVFEPLRRRVQHGANVLVYGKRATPYEVLTGATKRLSDTSDPDQVLMEVAKLVGEGTGAVQTVLWLAVGGTMHARASFPTDAVEERTAFVLGGVLMSGIPGDRVVAVRHRGDLLGALSITKARGDAVNDADEKLLADVAAGAGSLLRNLSLNAQLAERAEELRLSRKRLVATQDAERHRLERDLHDGAQQQVVALKVKLGVARALAERDGADRIAIVVASLADDTQVAVDGMRAVAHGIYPPLLEAEGLGAAFNAAIRMSPIAVEFEARTLGRYQRPVEESLYFAVLGILAQGIDGGATEAHIMLTGGDRRVIFSVRHDGAMGDIVSVKDRLEAFGGSIGATGDEGFVVFSGYMPDDGVSLEVA